MIVGTKRDMVICPKSLADVNKYGFDYIGSLCTKIDANFRFLPDTNVSGFYAKKLGNAYCIYFGHMPNEPRWAHCEGDILNIDIFVKREKHSGRYPWGLNEDPYIFTELPYIPANTKVEHGHWVPNSDFLKADCSRCGRGRADIWHTNKGIQFLIKGEEANFCYVCGAKMDKNENEGGNHEKNN